MVRTQVLVVGAGPAGLVSALCLAQQGVAVMVVERNAATSHHPKAHEINARSVEILRSLGIAQEELLREAAPFSDGARILFCHSINQEYGRIDLYADEERRAKYQRHLESPTPYLNLSQTELEKILLQHAEDHPNINIRFQHQWQQQKQSANRVVSQILNRTTDESLEIESDYVLAADGAGSRCRRAADITMDGPEQIDDFASAYFETDLRAHLATTAKLFWILNPHSPGTFIAHHVAKRWVYMMPVYLEHQTKEQFDKPFFENRIRTALGDHTLDIDVTSISFWRMSAQIASTYRDHRMLLVGDAAHRFPPTGGLGMNTGIADAHNLCWKLAAVLNGRAGEKILDTFEAERKPVAVQNSENSLVNYHRILDVPEAFGLDRDALRDLARVRRSRPFRWIPARWFDALLKLVETVIGHRMQRSFRDPAMQDKVHRTIADQIAHFDRIGLDIGYHYEGGSTISDGTTAPVPDDPVTQYVPSCRPGARFPFVRFPGQCGMSSSHDFFDSNHFTLVIDGAGQPWVEAANRLSETIFSYIRIVDVTTIELTDELQKHLRALLGIGDAGALIIRPDGHVGWRQRKAAAAPSKVLEQTFERLLCRGGSDSHLN